jgi:plasmid stabilization system protein ParE
VSDPIAEIDRYYVVRLRQQAISDMSAGHSLMVKASNYRIADDWQDGFFEALRSLCRVPRSRSLCPEFQETPDVEVRQLWYRRTPNGPAWRAIFTIDDTESQVDVLHLRHGSRRPLTHKEQREITTLKPGDGQR